MKKLLSSLLALTMALSLAVLPSSALELEDAKKLLAIHYVDGVAPEVLELDSPTPPPWRWAFSPATSSPPWTACPCPPTWTPGFP